MDIAPVVAAAAAAYILGSVNASIILSRLIMRSDIRAHGSGNAGTTNTLRTMGKRAAAAVFLIDALKAFAAVIIGGVIASDTGAFSAALFCILGHSYPIFFGFKGGKGIASTAGAFLALDIKIFIAAILVFIVIVAVTRYVSLGSILAALSIPILSFIFDTSLYGRTVCIILAVFIILRHRENIKKLISKSESKLSFKKKVE